MLEYIAKNYNLVAALILLSIYQVSRKVFGWIGDSLVIFLQARIKAKHLPEALIRGVLNILLLFLIIFSALHLYSLMPKNKINFGGGTYMEYDKKTKILSTYIEGELASQSWKPSK